MTQLHKSIILSKFKYKSIRETNREKFNGEDPNTLLLCTSSVPMEGTLFKILGCV